MSIENNSKTPSKTAKFLEGLVDGGIAASPSLFDVKTKREEKVWKMIDSPEAAYKTSYIFGAVTGRVGGLVMGSAAAVVLLYEVFKNYSH